MNHLELLRLITVLDRFHELNEEDHTDADDEDHDCDAHEDRVLESLKHLGDFFFLLALLLPFDRKLLP